ncbi:MAG: MgtC/SapB family protein [Phenylobacterium sp.]|nr:MAG: MgtC/SapB family protein [Phenylobacterium sp.]
MTGGTPLVTPIAEVAFNLVTAWGMGSVVGWERTYNGRLAGLRTHGLVALAAAAVMTLAYAPALSPGIFGKVIQLEAAPLAQGVMTGLGFLGAGVIFKEGVSVQGLTTAAALWTSAALGLLCGLGLQLPAALATVIAFFTLTVLRWVEAWAPARVLGIAVFRFTAKAAPDEAGLRRLLGDHAVSLQDVSYGRIRDGKLVEYRGSIESRSHKAFEALAERLRTLSELVEFDLSRISK